MTSDVVLVNPEIQGGTPCFKGTRVPIVSLFEHLEGGYSIDGFIEQFPTVKREQAVALLDSFRRQVCNTTPAAA